MNFPIYGDDVTLTPQGKILDNIFKFTGDGLTKLGLPSGFFFQMPDKFALPTEQSINQHGQLINTLPITRGMCLLTEYIRSWIWNKQDQEISPVKSAYSI